jgi:hypothetical protein
VFLKEIAEKEGVSFCVMFTQNRQSFRADSPIADEKRETLSSYNASGVGDTPLRLGLDQNDCHEWN